MIKGTLHGTLLIDLLLTSIPLAKIYIVNLQSIYYIALLILLDAQSNLFVHSTLLVFFGGCSE